LGNNTLSGINFYTCANSQVRSNTVEFDGAGITLASCPNVTVNGNGAYGNVHQGVVLRDSGGSVVSMNSIGNNGWEGLSLLNSRNSTTDENTVYANGHFGIWLQDSPDVNVLGCNVSYNGQGATPWDGIYLSNSNNSRILNNVMNGNGDAGCRVYYTDSITFLGDNITGNRDGLRIFISSSDTISDNEISHNFENGMNIFNSTGNMIFQNRFVNNTVDVLSQGSVNTWDDGYPAGGNYWSNYTEVDVYWGPNQDRLGSDGIGDLPYGIDPDNIDRYPSVIPFRLHDLTFSNVSALPSEVYVGWVFNINATVMNSGGYVETFSVTAYYGDVVIGTNLVGNLTVGESFAATLTWNTSSLKPCQIHDVKVKISTVPVETPSEDNTYSFGSTKVKMVGDASGDGKVNTLDIAAVGTAFGLKVGEGGYSPNYDMNMDNVINIRDVALTAKNCGRVCT
jgi:parallel beta-helix repeat protein